MVGYKVHPALHSSFFQTVYFQAKFIGDVCFLTLTKKLNSWIQILSVYSFIVINVVVYQILKAGVAATVSHGTILFLFFLFAIKINKNPLSKLNDNF